MTSIYVEVTSNGRLSLENAVTLFLNESSVAADVKLSYFVNETMINENTPFELNEKPATTTSLPSSLEKCRLPAAIKGHSLEASEDAGDIIEVVYCGLCSVLRTIVKPTIRDGNQKKIGLLGLNNMCLKACRDVSIWTRYCELILPGILRKLSSHTTLDADAIHEIHSLEKHFTSFPVVSNRNKRERDQPVKRRKGMKSLDHDYIEGIDATLTDYACFPMMHCVIQMLSTTFIESTFPLLYRWYGLMEKRHNLLTLFNRLFRPIECRFSIEELSNLRAPIVITRLTSKISRVDGGKNSSTEKYKFDEITSKVWSLDERDETTEEVGRRPLLWDEFPEDVHPKRGSLPANRLLRKCQQLESIAGAVMDLTRDGDVVVDFCAGGGHLGILLAFLKPKSSFVLVENKEESIEFALSRIAKLRLRNISIYKCNLMDFIGSFDVGTALHACGVATDLVIAKCTAAKARFAISPCCYGSVAPTVDIPFPRSTAFNKRLNVKEYQYLAHVADQTEVNSNKAEKGRKAMKLIDTDRLLAVRDLYSSVTLMSLKPLSCSPKNNLLIANSN